MRSSTLLLVLAVGVGCASTAARTTSPAATTSSPASATTSSAATSSATPSAIPSAVPEASSFPVVGIAECDAYLARYRACMSTQHDAREVEERARVMAGAWQKAATSEAGRNAMIGACKQAMDALTQVPGCTP